MSAPGGGGRGDLIYLAPHRWATIAQRPQHLTAALAAGGWRVLYVEPLAHSVLGNLRRIVTGRPAGPWRGRVARRGERLWSYTPPPGLPLTMASARLNGAAHRLAAPGIRRVARRLDFAAPILVAGWPLAGPLAGRLGARAIVYDCMDDFAAIPQSARRRRVLVGAERSLAGRAALIVATSAALVARWRAEGHDARLVPNAVAETFLAAVAAGPAPPPDLAAIPGRRLLFTGTIDHRLDPGLLAATLRARPDLSIVLIGPAQADLAALAGLPNVHLLGPRPHAALPAYLAAADACLIPFARSAFTDAVNPVKVYEYLATGAPIVAASLPELAPFAPLCYTGEGTDGWLRAIDAALAEPPDDPRRAERRRIAREHTWGHRAERLGAILAALPEAPAESAR